MNGRSAVSRGAMMLLLLLACSQPQRPQAQTPAVAPAPQAAPTPMLAPNPAQAMLARVSVIGASQSAGFGDGIALHRVLRLALADGPKIFDASSSAHFVDAHTIGKTQAVASRLRQPTIVIGVDFLFWFAHGVKPFEQRLADLREGIELLEGIGAPVLVGDLPDVSGASPRMITAAQIPSPEERARLNEEIGAWAAGRASVTLLPLAAWMAGIGSEALLQVWGTPVNLSATEALQWDGLHPTPRGQALLALLVLEEFERAYGSVGAAIRERDPVALGDVVAAPAEDVPLADSLPPPPTAGH